MKKHYQTLGLQEDASQEEIQEAYLRLSDTLDPKKNDNLDFFIEEYDLVQEAYKFLKKEVKKTPEPKQIAADSIESIFETYKEYDTAKKIDFLKELEDKINSGSQNYKIALNIICKYEHCSNLELLFQKLKPTPKEKPKETTKVVSKPAKTSIKEKENLQKVIAVTDSDTSSTLINKYNEAPKESKEGVLALFKVLGTTGHKECLLALHVLLGEPLDLDENLLVMVVQGIASNPQASDKSSIKEGKGEFGLSKTNPIPVYGIPSNEIYLKQLKTNLGGKITWKRKGSIKVKEIEKEIDEYLIFDEKGKKIATFFISPYHWKTSKKLPKGFIHVNEVPSNNKKNTKSNPKNTTNPEPSKPKNESKEPTSNKKKNTNKVVLISFISLISLVLMYLFSLKPEKNSSFPKKIITKESKVKTIPKKLSDIEIQFKANTDTTSYKLNQTIQLEFTLSQDASSFIPPSFEDFNVLAGPSQNISNTWQSGKYSYKKTYKYELSPKKTGQFVIAPASIDYMGFTFATDSIFIKILPKKRVVKRRKKKPQITYDSEYYNKLGLKNFEKEEYENALINFSKASELDPKGGAYYYSIGIVKTYLDDKVGACYQFSKALKFGYKEAQKVIDSYCEIEKEEEKPIYVSIRGKIIDHKNRTVVGAKVTNKTTGESVSVNFDGEYSLKAKEGDVILFEHVKWRRYPDIKTSFESSFGNIINVKFLTKRKIGSRLILKKWDPKYKAYSKTITSKY
jgi:tetratricopeptide (TPR) repeat protein